MNEGRNEFRGPGRDESHGPGERAVVLAEVDAVGAEFEGEVEVVVEDEGDSGGAAEREEVSRRRDGWWRGRGLWRGAGGDRLRR